MVTIITVASAIYVSEPTVLKEGAKQPAVNVNKEQDKVVLRFQNKKWMLKH